MVEVGVGVGWLGSWRGIWSRREGGVAGDEAERWVGTEGCGCDFGHDGVWVLSEGDESYCRAIYTDVD